MLEIFKRDSLRVGIVLAIVAPLLIFYIGITIKASGLGVKPYLVTLLYLKSLSKVLSLCVYPNLLIFYLYLRSNRETTAKGIVWGTLIMALIVGVIYFLQKIY
jgi:hypothetical protein